MTQVVIHPFDPDTYVERIEEAARFIRSQLPADFTPRAAITLGSGGLGAAADLITTKITIPYVSIPHFSLPTVVGHAGTLIAGLLNGVPVLGFQGRRHYYEFADEPSQLSALKTIVFPVYVARALGAKLYCATNAAGGLNPQFKPGDLMIINDHLDLFYPNPLAGPVVLFADAPRFQPQHLNYTTGHRQALLQVAEQEGLAEHVHQGVYAAVTGPTYESRADSRLLRQLGVDAVGMSTVPEIMVAANLGMETLGLSLISNVIAKDGTNATSHEEVTAALEDLQTKKRLLALVGGFFEAWR